MLVLGPSDKFAMHKNWLEAFNSQTNNLVLEGQMPFAEVEITVGGQEPNTRM